MPQDQGELNLVPEIQALQARLDMSTSLFRQIVIQQVAHENIALQLDNVIDIYHQIPSNYRLQIEIDEKGYKNIGGKEYDFARIVPDVSKQNGNRYFIIVKAPIEHLQAMPENATAVELSRKDYSPTGPTAFELIKVRKQGFDHGPSLWPENVVAMKIVPNTSPLPT